MNTLRHAAFLMFFVACTAFAQNIRIVPVDHNSSNDDFGLTPTNHGRLVYFTSDRSGEQQIYSMERTSSGWTEPDKLGGKVNSATHVGTCALTTDGQYMVFAGYEHNVDGLGRTDLYSATRENGTFKNITNLAALNSSFYDSQPTLSADGRTMLFVSDRTGGAGKTDIYLSTWNGKEWSTPKQVTGINSAASEMSPVLASDGRTVYFASDRQGGKGGFDVYVAKLSGLDATNVRPVGEPINTAADELFYTSIPNSDQAYFTRATASGDYDNFMAVPNPFPSDPVVLVEGIVRDSVSREPLGSAMSITDLSTGKAIATLHSDDETGRYYVTLVPGRVYSITSSRQGYMFHSERYEVPPAAKGSTVQKDIDLIPLSSGKTGSLLVFFDNDKSELKPESMPELERVIELMRENANISVRFEGHTDDKGSDDYNVKLSERRAESVRDYIIAAGIERTRIESAGYGKKKPLSNATTEDARALNRRVEMRIISTGK
ncbi:MAG: PD40 domain-containing protein [Bacteroidetes bacterium]|nr:PD40 domain-containing protein [Bacteroidota bacterium]